MDQQWEVTPLNTTTMKWTPGRDVTNAQQWNQHNQEKQDEGTHIV